MNFNERLCEGDLDLFRVGTVKDIAEYILYRGNLRKVDNPRQFRKILEKLTTKIKGGDIDVEDPAHEKS